MIKFRAKQADGRWLLVFGLSAENIKRLQKDKPIRFKLDEVSEFEADVMIYAGTTEDEMQAGIERIAQIPKPS